VRHYNIQTIPNLWEYVALCMRQPQRAMRVSTTTEINQAPSSHRKKTAYPATMANIPMLACPAFPALFCRPGPVPPAVPVALAFAIAAETMLVAAAKSDWFGVAATAAHICPANLLRSSKSSSSQPSLASLPLLLDPLFPSKSAGPPMHVPTFRARDWALPARQRQEKSVGWQLMVFAADSKQGTAQGGSCSTRRGRPVAWELGAVAIVTLGCWAGVKVAVGVN
jgi:hypothetical protein